MTAPVLVKPDNRRVRASEFSAVDAENAAGRTGIVYFLANLSADTVKIGFTTNIKKRVDVLQTGNHNRLEVCATLSAPPSVERFIHEAVSDYRVFLEWFEHNGIVDDLIRKFEEFEIETGVATGNFSPLITSESLRVILERWRNGETYNSAMDIGVPHDDS